MPAGIVWVRLVDSAPAQAQFGHTYGQGSPLVVDYNAGTAYVLHPVTGLPVAIGGGGGSPGPTGSPGPAIFLSQDPPEPDFPMPGRRGATGAPGATGPQGTPGRTMLLQGDSGEQGDLGPPGKRGATGPAGAIGPRGSRTYLPGEPGEEGPQGPPGPRGRTGASGPAGSQGLDGRRGLAVFLTQDPAEPEFQIPGPRGKTGATGPAGGGGGGGSSSSATIDFGATPVAEATFTITDASITAASVIDCFFQGDSTADNDTSSHLQAGRSFRLTPTPASGSFSLDVQALLGLVTGTFTLHYTF